MTYPPGGSEESTVDLLRGSPTVVSNHKTTVRVHPQQVTAHHRGRSAWDLPGGIPWQQEVIKRQGASEAI